MSKTIIIGGGIAGLAAAFSLQESGASDFTVVESSPQWGGKITSRSTEGFLIEGGPDSFITQKPAAVELCRRLGLGDQLVGSNTGPAATTYVWNRSRLRAMPEGMMLMTPTMVLPFLRSNLISWPGKLRMGLEPFVPRATHGKDVDESLASFVRRRLGSEALDTIAGPLMGGIHAADPEQLSLRSTFPMFLDMEARHGSLLRGMMKRPKRVAASGTKPMPMFVTLNGGLQQLADALVSRLTAASLRSGCSVLAVHLNGKHYTAALSDGTVLDADNIVFATPAYVAAELLQQVDPLLAARLHAIRYVSTATVSLGFKRSEIAHPMLGAGFIVPRNQGRRITACSWSSVKFNHRAPADSVLLRVFIGGALAEPLAEQDESALIQLAREELRVIMGIDAIPVLAQAYRWPKANPQYDLGHQARIAEIEHALAAHPGLHLAGAGYRGSGLPDCIQSGMNAALAIAERNHARHPYQDQHAPVCTT